MSAPKGNKFWEARSSHGANPKFAEPKDLWDACLEYFEWVEQNPLKEAKVVQDKGRPKTIEISKMRAMTVNERTKLTRFQHLKLTHLLWRKAPSRAAFT